MVGIHGGSATIGLCYHSRKRRSGGLGHDVGHLVFVGSFEGHDFVVVANNLRYGLRPTSRPAEDTGVSWNHRDNLGIVKKREDLSVGASLGVVVKHFSMLRARSGGFQVR